MFTHRYYLINHIAIIDDIKDIIRDFFIQKILRKRVMMAVALFCWEASLFPVFIMDLEDTFKSMLHHHRIDIFATKDTHDNNKENDKDNNKKDTHDNNNKENNKENINDIMIIMQRKLQQIEPVKIIYSKCYLHHDGNAYLQWNKT